MGQGGDEPLGIGGLLRVAWSYLGAHRRLAVLSLLTVAPQVGFTVGYPLIVRRLIDEALPEADRPLVLGLIVTLVGLQDGDVFGEIALLEDVPHTATIRCRVDALLLSLRREPFQRLLDRQPRLLATLESTASERHRRDAERELLPS